MKRAALFACLFAAAVVFGATNDVDMPEGMVCKDGVCEISPAFLAKLRARRAAATNQTAQATNHEPRTTSHEPRPLTSHEPRLLIGYVSPDEMLSFINPGSESRTTNHESRTTTLWLLFLLVFWGGTLLNLTPCVLPLVPVTVILVGKGWKRGAAYGLGMACVYGVLGLAAAFGGAVFGGIQSNPWFNAATAAVFAFLALGMAGVVQIAGLSRFRKPGARAMADGEKKSLLAPFLLGGGAALLAGACVAPVAIACCTETAVRCAEGEWAAAALPLALGLGMGAPYPFLAAGLKVLPRPGAWMTKMKLLFALVLAAFAFYYGRLAVRGFGLAHADPVGASHETRVMLAQSPKSENKSPLFVVVGAPWCKNCTALEKNVLQDERVEKALARFNVRHVEIERFEELKSHALLKDVAERIRGLPACVIFEK